MNTLPELQKNVRDITTASEAEYVAGVMNDLAVMKKAIKEAEDRFKMLLFEWIEANGPFTVGDTRYYNGRSTKTTCESKSLTLQMLLDACDGDFDKIAELLAAQPFKYGAVKSVLSEPEFHACFSVREVEDVKTGKPKRETKSLPVSMSK